MPANGAQLGMNAIPIRIKVDDFPARGLPNSLPWLAMINKQWMESRGSTVSRSSRDEATSMVGGDGCHVPFEDFSGTGPGIV